MAERIGTISQISETASPISRDRPFAFSPQTDWALPVSDEAAREAIRHILDSGSSQEDRNGTYPSVQIPLTEFRKSGLLGMLNIKFGGDISEALRFAYPDSFKKPLLRLDEIRYGDPMWEQWKQHEDRIESKIISTMVKRQRGHFLVFKKRTIPEKEVPQLPGHERLRLKQRSDQEDHLVKKYSDEWWNQENIDLKNVIERFVRQGDTALSFLSGHDAVIPSLVLGRTCQDGKLYIITPDPYLKEGLSEAFFRLFVNLQSIKGEINPHMTGREAKERKKERKTTGSGLIDINFRRRARNILSTPFRVGDEAFYMDGLDWKNNGLIDKFFDQFHIIPMRQSPAHTPKEIPRKSLDVVIECDSFSQIAEEGKETVLFEMDKALKHGGYLIFRENARQQALIEYYGQDLLSQKYQRVNLKGINSAQIVVFRKSSNNGDSPSAETPPASSTEETSEIGEKIKVCNKEHNWDLKKDTMTEDQFSKELYLRLKHLIRANHRIGEGIYGGYNIDESLKQKLSLNWFKKVGLLQPLMAEFGGRIDKLVDFVMLHSSSEQWANDTLKKGNLLSTSLPKPPENSKPFYTVEDLAKELELPVSIIKKHLKNSGVGPVRTRSYAGQSGFGKQVAKATRLRFSPQEYAILKDSLKGWNLKVQTKEQDGKPN